MARVYLASVPDSTPQACAAALERGLRFLGRSVPARAALAFDPSPVGVGTRRALRPLLGGSGSRLLRVSARDALLFQLTASEGAPLRLSAHEALYGSDPLLLCPSLSWDAAMDGVGGALLLIGRALLAEPVDAMDPDERAAMLAAGLEVADPDLIVGDGRRLPAYEGCPAPPTHALGLLLIADDAVAHDATWARILGLRPEDNPVLRRGAERGFGVWAEQQIALGGDESLTTFARRVQGFAPPLPPVDEVPRWERARSGVPLPIEVIARRRETGAVLRVRALLAALLGESRRRERLPSLPPLALLAGPRAPGVMPACDAVLAVGPDAAASLLSDVSVVSAVERPRLLARWRGVGGALWELRLVDGRRVQLAALPDGAPSLRALGRAARAVAGWPDLDLPDDRPRRSLLARLWAAVGPAPFPPRLVHARRIPRLAGRAWRARWPSPAVLRRTLAPPGPPPLDAHGR